ncbi:hypothetical protein N0V86_008415 [Didymella sp. IMI 355093]|nr:hypothetical protein N0V86_008415 [Didymella sp. IMI 355093]
MSEPKQQNQYEEMRVSAYLQLLTIQTHKDGPMIDIIKVSEWLTKNVNEKLYPRLLLMSPNGNLLAYSTPVNIKELRDQAALISAAWKEQCIGRQTQSTPDPRKDSAREDAEAAQQNGLKPPLETLTIQAENCNILPWTDKNFPLLILFGKPQDDPGTFSAKRDSKDADKVTFFKADKPPNDLKRPAVKRDSEDISPTRVGPGGTQQRVEKRGESSRREHDGLTAPTKAALAREVNAKQTKERVSTFIMASQFKNMRMPTADEFPSQPRGMYLYATGTELIAKDGQSRKASVPPTTGGEASSQPVPRQAPQMETARGSLSRIYADGPRVSTSEALYAVPSPNEQTAPNGPASKRGLSLACSPHSMDETALATTSQSTILNSRKGKADTMNDSSVEAGSSNNNASAPSDEPPTEGSPPKKDKGKGKAVAFSESQLRTEIHASAPRGLPGGTTSSGEPESESESDVIAVDDRDIRAASRPTRKDKGKGKAMESPDDGNTMKDSTSTWESTSRNSSGVEAQPARTAKGKGRAVESPDRLAYDNSGYPLRASTVDDCAIDDLLQPHHEPEGVPEFVIKHCSTDVQDSNQARPSQADPSTLAEERAAARAMEAMLNTAEMQNTVRGKLGIDEIPSPTVRPTKSLTDHAIGYLYSVRKRQRWDEKREEAEGEDAMLD